MSPRKKTIAALAAVLAVTAAGAPCPASPAAAAPAGGPAAALLGAPEVLACRDDPRARLEAVADLLIDRRPAEAAAAVRHLLAAGGLAPREAARARALLAKAEALLPPPPPPPPEPPPPPFPAASFRVRQAEIGGGFSAGTSGSLRLAGDGVSFVAAGASEAAWSVGWEHVVELSRDRGLWDADHPLVLRSLDGPPRYLALVDGEGDALPPAPLLSAFARAREEAERRGAAAEPPSPAPGKEQPR